MSSDGRALLDRADKAVKSAGSGFSFFGGREEKWENAAQLYIDAANAFRAENNGKEAGRAFERAAAIQRGNLNEPDDAANSLSDAFKCYRKTDPEDAARVMEEAIRHYISKGNFRRAATQMQHLAELYEAELGYLGKAKDAYEKAANWYDNDNATANANRNWLKFADLTALGNEMPSPLPDDPAAREKIEKAVREVYNIAVKVYEQVAESSIKLGLKYNAKEYLFKAGFCLLAAGDMIEVGKGMQRWPLIDVTFPTTGEYQHLSAMIDAVDKHEPKEFESVCYEWDRVHRLDRWQTTMLLRIKALIAEDKAEDFS